MLCTKLIRNSRFMQAFFSAFYMFVHYSLKHCQLHSISDVAEIIGVHESHFTKQNNRRKSDFNHLKEKLETAQKNNSRKQTDRTEDFIILFGHFKNLHKTICLCLDHNKMKLFLMVMNIQYFSVQCLDSELRSHYREGSRKNTAC